MMTLSPSYNNNSNKNNQNRNLKETKILLDSPSSEKRGGGGWQSELFFIENDVCLYSKRSHCQHLRGKKHSILNGVLSTSALFKHFSLRLLFSSFLFCPPPSITQICRRFGKILFMYILLFEKKGEEIFFFS